MQMESYFYYAIKLSFLISSRFDWSFNWLTQPHATLFEEGNITPHNFVQPENKREKSKNNSIWYGH